MQRLSVMMVMVLVVGLLFFGCIQTSPESPSLSPTAKASAFASATPVPSHSSGSVQSGGPTPDAYNMSGLDQASPDVDNLDNLTQDMSAGDVSPPPDNAS